MYEKSDMSIGQPQTKINEVVDYLENYQGMINHNDFKFRLWLRDADALIKSGDNVLLGYMMRGLTYLALGKLEEAEYAIANAYKFSKTETGVNYLTILARNGKSAKAFDAALELLTINPTNANVLYFLLNNIVSSLDVEKYQCAITLFKTTDKNSEELLAGAKQGLDIMMKTINKIELAGVPLEVYQYIMDKASFVLNQNYYGKAKVVVDFVTTEFGKFLHIQEYIMDVSDEDCLNLNEILEESIVNDDKFDFAEYQKIIYEFKPMSLEMEA